MKEISDKESAHSGQLRFVVSGGGTGGHVYPALAVAQELMADCTIDQVVYIGKTEGLESRLAVENGITFEGIPFYGMPRGKSLSTLWSILRWGFHLYRAKKHAKRLLRQIRPHVVFGTGGYVSAPVLMAARCLKIPYVIHEPDANPGLVNRLMGRNATAITTSFSEGAMAFKNKQQAIYVTGNPIRGAIGQMSKTQALLQLGLSWAEEQPVLLLIGGSQGARKLNHAMVEALPTLLNQLGVAVVHLTGPTLYEETLKALDSDIKNHSHYRIQPYSSDMAALLAIADIAFCRSGSLSLSEMYVCGIPTILVPYPYATGEHQLKNAQASVNAGASRLILDSECNGESLLAELRPLLENPELRAKMKQAALQHSHPHATQEITACLKSLALSVPSGN